MLEDQTSIVKKADVAKIVVKLQDEVSFMEADINEMAQSGKNSEAELLEFYDAFLLKQKELFLMEKLLLGYPQE